MRARCRAKTGNSYRDYASKGIKTSDEWANYLNFLMDMGEQPEGLTIDRIDNSKGYSKENCRWATVIEQARNKTNTRWITINGETKCMREWAGIYNISYKLVHARITDGWDEVKALSTPVRKTSTKLHFKD